MTVLMSMDIILDTFVENMHGDLILVISTTLSLNLRSYQQ